MAELDDQTSTQALIRDMGLTEHEIERRRSIVGLDARDMKRLAAIRDLVVAHVETHASAFFDHLAALEEARPLLGNRPLMERARQLKAEHIASIVQSDYGLDYVLKRIELGRLFSRAGLDLRVFLGAFQALLRSISSAIMRRFDGSPSEGFEHCMSLHKVGSLDIGLIVDVLVFERQRVIRQQQDAIRELSTPVLQLRDRMLLLPIIGVIDTHRARLITEGLLNSIRMNRAKVVVMDITGVATIDSKVSNHLLQTVSAAA